MSGNQRVFTTDEVLELLDDYFDIPADSELSDLSDYESDDDNIEELASDRNLVEEQSTVLDNIHALDIVDVGDNANDVERRRSGPVNSFDFSIYDWCIGPHEDFSQNYGQFRHSVGPTTVLPRAATALDFFKLLFSMNIVNRIVVKTNKYAQQQYEAAGKDFESFQLVTKEEFTAFIGIFIAMGIHRLPSIRDYWSTDWVLGLPSLVRCMPRHRFEKVFQYLHLNDNTNMVPKGNPGFDKLFKMRPFIDSIRANFLHEYSPGENQSVDEAMIKFKGRTTLKQYMPKKPIKREIKMWCRADSKSGYLSDFDIYVGRSGKETEQNLGYAVVTRLCQAIYGRWHTVYFDNFFTSLSLVEELFCNKTMSCGTVRSGRRNFPKELFDKAVTKNMNRGDYAEKSKGLIKNDNLA